MRFTDYTTATSQVSNDDESLTQSALVIAGLSIDAAGYEAEDRKVYVFVCVRVCMPVSFEQDAAKVWHLFRKFAHVLLCNTRVHISDSSTSSYRSAMFARPAGSQPLSPKRHSFLVM